MSRDNNGSTKKEFVLLYCLRSNLRLEASRQMNSNYWCTLISLTFVIKDAQLSLVVSWLSSSTLKNIDSNKNSPTRHDCWFWVVINVLSSQNENKLPRATVNDFQKYLQRTKNSSKTSIDKFSWSFSSCFSSSGVKIYRFYPILHLAIFVYHWRFSLPLRQLTFYKFAFFMPSDTRFIRLITFTRVKFLMLLHENSFLLNKNSLLSVSWKSRLVQSLRHASQDVWVS